MVLGLSARVAFCCAVAVAIPGIACGWLLARTRFPGKSLFDAILHAPLVMPPVVTGYLLLVLLDFWPAILPGDDLAWPAHSLFESCKGFFKVHGFRYHIH